MPIVGNFPRPDWRAIAKLIESLPETGRQDEWSTWARHWVQATAGQLHDGYRIAESDNFLLLSAQDDRYVELLSQFLERARRRILSSLDGIALDDGFGKNVVLIFDEQEPYYEYTSYFYPEEGEFILSSGVFLNSEYGHFAFPFLEMDSAEPTAAHELTHACLRHLPIPLWLNEGFAVTMEEEICGFQPLAMEKERFNGHQAFWTADTIQEFWSGYSFNRTDEGSGLSYELARFCLRSLAHDYDVFTRFVNTASFEDGGESAAVEAFGGSLGGVIHQFFGEGDWSPRPAEWPAQSGAGSA